MEPQSIRSGMLDIGGGIQDPAVVTELVQRLGALRSIIATCRGNDGSVLVATASHLHLGFAGERPRLLSIPYQNIATVSAEVGWPISSITLLLDDADKTLFRFSCEGEIGLARLASLIRDKIEPGDMTQGHPLRRGPRSRRHRSGQRTVLYIAGFLGVTVLDAALSLNLIRFGPYEIAAAVFLCFGFYVAKGYFESDKDETHQPKSRKISTTQPPPITSKHLDIGGGISTPSSVTAIHNTLALAEDIRATVHGTSHTSMVVTSRRILVLSESEYEPVKITPLNYDQISKIDTSLESDPCLLTLHSIDGAYHSVHVPKDAYNQLNELALRLRAKLKHVNRTDAAA